MPLPSPIAEPSARCKVCGQAAPLNGVVDFSKHCEIFTNRDLLPLTGIPVYYYRCPSCGFLFTTAFDQFTNEEFRTWIYNDDYIKVDPEYPVVRPDRLAQFIANEMPGGRNARILDYGGGNGRMTQALRGYGFTDVTCYDPFVPAFSDRPQGEFDCILCFEVIEHTTNPRQTVGEMVSMLKTPGIIVFSTVFLTPQDEAFPVAWWYVAPRNGHASIFTSQSMKLLAGSMGYQVGSFNEAIHVMLKQPPAFVMHWFNQQK